MARSKSPDTRLLHSLVRRQLALLSIYSAQRLRDHEQSMLCAVNSYWTADKENRNIGVQDRCHITWFRLWRVNKSKLSQYHHYLKSRFGNIVFQAMNWFADLGMHLTSGRMPLNGIAQSDIAGCQTTCFSHRIRRDIWQFNFNGYLYLSYTWI